MKNKLSIEDIERTIIGEQDYKLGMKTTAVVLTLRSGFEVTGLSACVDPNNYDHNIGKKYAREDAVKKIWQLEAYVLQIMLFDPRGAVKDGEVRADLIDADSGRPEAQGELFSDKNDGELAGRSLGAAFVDDKDVSEKSCSGEKQGEDTGTDKESEDESESEEKPESEEKAPEGEKEEPKTASNMSPGLEEHM